MNAREKQANSRLRLLLAVFILVFGVVLGRAVWLQIVRAEDFERMAKSQHRETQKTPAGRGTIFDRTGVQRSAEELPCALAAEDVLIDAQRPGQEAPLEEDAYAEHDFVLRPRREELHGDGRRHEERPGDQPVAVDPAAERAGRERVPSGEADDELDPQPHGGALARKRNAKVEYIHKVRFWDKNAALEKIAKYLGMFVDRHEFGGINGAPIKTEVTHTLDKASAKLIASLVE